MTSKFYLGPVTLEKTEFTNVFRFYRSDGRSIGLEKSNLAWFTFCLAYMDIISKNSNSFNFEFNEDGDGGIKLIVTNSDGTFPAFLTNQAIA